ncbi:MAG: argininosuccinate lyase [Anaerolineales bacterium]|nr:MAG: argininosuccinate lyase [Anaerolineales bacterium]
MTTLWGGRFADRPDDLMRRFGDSIGFDIRLWDADVTASMAYAKALARVGIIDEDERYALLEGLARVRTEFADGEFLAQPDDEDIHTAIERRLGELVGRVAGKLHTGRSRNDQVTTDTRLYLREQIARLRQQLAQLQRAIVDRAQAHIDLLMPGYTHLQPAQPVRFSHWLLSFFWMLQRDRDRLEGLTRRVNVLPLGAGALSGNPFGIDQAYLARELGFEAVALNSMDIVSDRDYLVEFLSWASLTQIHLSRLAGDLILYSSREFGFMEIADAYATGSSLMPQKKNADSLELIRGKTGRVVGDLVSILMVLKGLPTTYNKDLQEDKEALFDTIDTLTMTLPISSGIIETLVVHPERMQAALTDEMLATELADYLVRKGVPFREAHHMVGQVVQKALAQGAGLRDLLLSDYQEVSRLFDRDLMRWLNFEQAVERRDSVGGTARASLETQLAVAERLLG